MEVCVGNFEKRYYSLFGVWHCLQSLSRDYATLCLKMSIADQG